MFEDSLLESGKRFHKGRWGAMTLLSFVLQGLAIGVLILIPLLYTEALPKQQLMTFLVAPPPPRRLRHPRQRRLRCPRW